MRYFKLNVNLLGNGMKFKVLDTNLNQFIVDNDRQRLFLTPEGNLVIATKDKKGKWHFYICEDLTSAGVEILYAV